MYLRPKPDGKTKQVLMGMHFYAWIAFIWMILYAGGSLFELITGVLDGEQKATLFQDAAMAPIRQFSVWHYAIFGSYTVALFVLKSFLLFYLIRFLFKMNPVNPFNREIARILEKISYTLILATIIVLLHDIHAAWLPASVKPFPEFWNLNEYLFVTGLVYIIARVFKRGVAMQSEKDLII